MFSTLIMLHHNDCTSSGSMPCASLLVATCREGCRRHQTVCCCTQNIPVAALQRGTADGEAPWPTTADIWYSERVVDMKDDVPKWCFPKAL